MGHSYAAFSLRRAQNGCEVVYDVDGEAQVVGVLNETNIELRVEVEDAANCLFSWRGVGEWQRVPTPFAAREGHWIGARVGIFCVGEKGSADFEYFRFAPPLFEATNNS